MMKQLLPALIAFAFLPLLAHADDSPLIWEVSEASKTSYAARLGTRLPNSLASSIGAELRLQGADLQAFGNPVSLWGSFLIGEYKDPGRMSKTRLDLRLDSITAAQRLSLADRRTLKMRLLDAELSHDVGLELNAGTGINWHARQKLRLSSPKGRTAMEFSTSQAGGERRQTEIGLRRTLRDAVTLNATLSNPGETRRDARFGASYRNSW